MNCYVSYLIKVQLTLGMFALYSKNGKAKERRKSKVHKRQRKMTHQKEYYATPFIFSFCYAPAVIYLESKVHLSLLSFLKGKSSKEKVQFKIQIFVEAWLYCEIQ